MMGDFQTGGVNNSVFFAAYADSIRQCNAPSPFLHPLFSMLYCNVCLYLVSLVEFR